MALLTKERRLFIKNELPYGAQIKIAKQANISLSLVCQYFSGRNNNDRVEKIVLEEYKKFKSEKQKALDIINELF